MGISRYDDEANGLINSGLNEYQDKYTDYEDARGGSGFSRRRYVLTELFEDSMSMGYRNGGEMLIRFRDMVAAKMMDKLAYEGYPRGSYKLEFSVDSEPSRRLIRITCQAVVDERMKERVTYFDSDAANDAVKNPADNVELLPLTAEQMAAKELQERAMVAPLKMKRNIRMEK